MGRRSWLDKTLNKSILVFHNHFVALSTPAPQEESAPTLK